jgi:hypothetical protein
MVSEDGSAAGADGAFQVRKPRPKQTSMLVDIHDLTWRSSGNSNRRLSSQFELVS